MLLSAVVEKWSTLRQASLKLPRLGSGRLPPRPVLPRLDDSPHVPRLRRDFDHRGRPPGLATVEVLLRPRPRHGCGMPTLHLPSLQCLDGRHLRSCSSLRLASSHDSYAISFLKAFWLPDRSPDSPPAERPLGSGRTPARPPLPGEASEAPGRAPGARGGDEGPAARARCCRSRSAASRRKAWRAASAAATVGPEASRARDPTAASKATRPREMASASRAAVAASRSRSRPAWVSNARVFSGATPASLTRASRASTAAKSPDDETAFACFKRRSCSAARRASSARARWSAGRPSCSAASTAAVLFGRSASDTGTNCSPSFPYQTSDRYLDGPTRHEGGFPLRWSVVRAGRRASDAGRLDRLLPSTLSSRRAGRAPRDSGNAVSLLFARFSFSSRGHDDATLSGRL